VDIRAIDTNECADEGEAAGGCLGFAAEPPGSGAMISARLFGKIVHVTAAGAAVVERDDGGGYTRRAERRRLPMLR
jgi:hypothetical protein